MDPAEFRTLGHELVDWIADYRARIAGYPVMSRVQPGEVAAQLPAEPPRQGEGLAGIASELERVVLPGDAGYDQAQRDTSGADPSFWFRSFFSET